MPVHQLTFPDTDSKEYSSARYHYLLQIVFGETIAIDYCKRMASFAPTQAAHDFLLRQQEEENKHLELLTDFVGNHPRPHMPISSHLRKLDALMSNALERKDYIDCVFIQNFLLEGLNISLLRELEHHTDVVLSELSRKILDEEIAHMEFGVSEMKRIMKESADIGLHRKLVWLHRKTLFHSWLLARDLKREAGALGIPVHELTYKTLNEHYDRLTRAEFPLPLIDRIILRGGLVFLNL